MNIVVVLIGPVLEELFKFGVASWFSRKDRRLEDALVVYTSLGLSEFMGTVLGEGIAWMTRVPALALHITTGIIVASVWESKPTKRYLGVATALAVHILFNIYFS